jgi:hypothetical protein
MSAIIIDIAPLRTAAFDLLIAKFDLPEGDDSAVTEEESHQKPPPAMKDGIINGLFLSFCELHGDHAKGSVRSEFFDAFNQRTRFSPRYRFCEDQEPKLKYIHGSDTWYFAWTAKLDARKRRMQVPQQLGVAHVIQAQQHLPLPAPAPHEGWIPHGSIEELRQENAALRSDIGAMEARLHRLETEVSRQGAMAYQMTENMQMIKIDYPRKRSSTKVAVRASTVRSKRPKLPPVRVYCLYIDHMLTVYGLYMDCISTVY